MKECRLHRKMLCGVVRRDSEHRIVSETIPIHAAYGSKQIEKNEKRIKELDRLFRKIYEDNVNGKLNDERFYKLSDGYEAEQEQLKQEIEALTAEVNEADTEAANVAKLIAITKKYTRIDELTSKVLNAFVDKIVVHERKKKDGKRTQKIDIYTIPMSGL
ncbi:DUF4368 domain-containing protein [bacterium D16-51]|nr:DUF4368 domain-containing protein [bacterium D16-59]RKI52525.1 DUF4368 domain-containing protein [bacterium D16-51]